MDYPQRYVSKELSHFVGRGKDSEEEQYKLLIQILQSGWLTHPPHHNPSVARTAFLDLSKPISTDEAIKYQVVCFCDIPEPDLGLHIKKYSQFGLAFKKDFLIPQGACPVFYVANEAPVPTNAVINVPECKERIDTALKEQRIDRALFFDTSIKGIFDILRGFDALNADENVRYFKYPDSTAILQNKDNLQKLFGLNDAQFLSLKSGIENNKQIFTILKICIDFLCNYIFSFIKCFDTELNLEDKKHYYMEREWRVAGNVKFDLNDVCRVFFPESYAKRFRKDFPSYSGQISFIS